MTGICGFSRAGRVALAGIACGALLVIAPAARAEVYGAQETLRFSGLSDPNGVAVDAAGDVFVGDFGNNRVVELPAGASTQVVLPSSGLDGPTDIAVDAAGDLFATEPSNWGTELDPTGPRGAVWRASWSVIGSRSAAAHTLMALVASHPVLRSPVVAQPACGGQTSPALGRPNSR